MRNRNSAHHLHVKSMDTEQHFNTQKGRSYQRRIPKIIALAVATMVLLTFGIACTPRASQIDNQTIIQTNTSKLTVDTTTIQSKALTITSTPTLAPTITMTPTPTPDPTPTPTPIPSPTPEPTIESTRAPETSATTETTVLVETAPLMDYVLNTNTMKFHKPSCSSADKIKPENRKEVNSTRDDVISQGYDPCGNCNP